MPSASSSDVKLEIGHVLFIDIVGYSKLLINEQSEQMQKLREIVRGTEQFRTAEAEGKLLRLPTGDGGALVFRTNVEAPVLCALEISKELKKHTELRVRMGIHSGPVNEITDLNEQANIAGAGINIAQRVMDCGDAGHILLSRHVAEDLEQYRQWQPMLHDLGECEVKHGVRIHAVNFYTDEVGNAEVPEKFRQAKEKEQTVPAVSTAAVKPAAPSRAWIAALVIGAAAIAVAGFYIFSHRFGSKPILEKSIAVLPFENRSEDKANAYFADGIQDEILTRLSKIADLKVISRTSTQQFQSKPANLSDIAKQLGVANILEGSVQRSTDQVRVNVQLIKAASDTHLWADTFDRRLTDIFSVESDIAQAVAETLRAKLSGAERSAIAARPTENSEAHDLYLKGRYFFAKREADNLRRAIDYFNQAIAKDPNYALAYAGIADSYALLPEWSTESAAEDWPKAKVAADRALSLDNKLAEAHVSRGLLFAEDFNLREAKQEFEHAIELNPNDADAHYFLGFAVLAPLGDFDHAIAEMNRALELNPFSVIINSNLGVCYCLARRYPEAIAQLRKTEELDPKTPTAVLGLAQELSGHREEAITEYQRAYDLSLGSEHSGDRAVTLATIYTLKGERAKALEQLDQDRELARVGKVPAFFVAANYLRLGDKSQAIDLLEQSYRNKEPFITSIKVNPLLDPLRGDPRFEALADKVIPRDPR
jgi:TolB-like protein/Tfp pilus assembly protein PilF